MKTQSFGQTHGWLGGKQRSADALAGLSLMGVRLYNAATGRFLQVDPVPGGSDNAYDYAGADPLNGFDLDGRRCWSVKCAKKWMHKHRKVIGQIAGVAGVVAFGACVIASGGVCAAVAAGAAAASIASRAAHHDNWMSKRFIAGAAGDVFFAKFRAVRSAKSIFNGKMTNYSLKYALRSGAGRKRFYRQGIALGWGTFSGAP